MKTFYQLYQGDCLKIMSQLDTHSIDLVIADPPYHIGDKSKVTKVRGKIMSTDDAWGHWESKTFTQYDLMLKKVLNETLRLLKPGGSAYYWLDRARIGLYWKYLEDKGFTPKNCIIWRKTNPMPHVRKNNYRSAYEQCIWFVRGDKPKTFNFLSQSKMNNVFDAPNTFRETEHPSEKPLKLMKWQMEISSDRGDIILDPFMGSGSTMKAAQELGRSCIGIEINPVYCEMIKKRCFGRTFLDRQAEYHMEAAPVVRV